ncbi:hypothetical protein CHS0354_024458, partial [Potamilus streckersoni]
MPFFVHIGITEATARRACRLKKCFRDRKPERLKVEDGALCWQRSLPTTQRLIDFRARSAKARSGDLVSSKMLRSHRRPGINSQGQRYRLFAIKDSKENCFAGHPYSLVQGGPLHYWTIELNSSL